MTDANAESMSETLSPVSLTRSHMGLFTFLPVSAAALSFVEGQSRSACFDAADVPNENAAELLTFRNEIA